MPEELYAHIPLIADLPVHQRALLGPLFRTCFIPAGQILFEQGEQADTLYLLQDGEVTVRYKPDDGPAIVVARVRSGGVVGWSAALGSPFYTSSANCVCDSVLLCIESADLHSLCEQYPDVGSSFLERLAEVVSERVSGAQDHVIALLEQGMRTNGDLDIGSFE